MSKKKKPKQVIPQPHSNLLSLFRAFIGPAFVIGGWQLIPLSYVAGVFIVYAGFAICLVECIWEPALLARSYQLQVALITFVFALAIAFSINVVFVSAPLNFDSYAMRKGEYPSGTVIAGIFWDSHLTDLRVSITNPTNDDYFNVDLAVQPDKWSYKSAILEENTGCLLTSMGGTSLLLVQSAKGGTTTVTAHRVGDKVEAADSVGDVFEHFITEGGYRLRCEKFPAHFTAQIVFALATVDRKLLFPRDLKSSIDLSVTEMLPMNKFDILEAKPSPSLVTIQGNYTRGVKRFSVSQTVQIADGN